MKGSAVRVRASAPRKAPETGLSCRQNGWREGRWALIGQRAVRERCTDSQEGGPAARLHDGTLGDVASGPPLASDPRSRHPRRPDEGTFGCRRAKVGPPPSQWSRHRGANDDRSRKFSEHPGIYAVGEDHRTGGGHGGGHRGSPPLRLCREARFPWKLRRLLMMRPQPMICVWPRLPIVSPELSKGKLP